MRREVLLPLYGRVSLDGTAWDLAWDLLQTETVQRLHDISLSSTPSRYVAAGMPASRFQHSTGVLLVADRITGNHASWARWRAPLMAAAALHDAAAGPSIRTLTLNDVQTTKMTCHGRSVDPSHSRRLAVAA